MRCIVFGVLIAGLFLLVNMRPLKGELWLRGGYLIQPLSTSKSYNKFLKERYGASSPQLSGLALSTTFRGIGKNWGVGIEYDDLSGSINYTTLQNTILFLAFYIGDEGNLELDGGYGTNKLTRTFYGYHDSYIVTTNIANQLGAQESSTKGFIQILQILYRLINSKLQLEAGGRYSVNNHIIPASDLRPGYSSAGIPTDMDFDLGGLGLITTLTYRF